MINYLIFLNSIPYACINIFVIIFVYDTGLMVLCFLKGVIDELSNACKRVGWNTPTPIQVAAIPHALKGQSNVSQVSLHIN